MINRGHVNNDGWVNNQDYRLSDYPPLVAVIGDSFIEAQMLPYAQTFHGLLAKLFEGKLRVTMGGMSFFADKLAHELGFRAERDWMRLQYITAPS